MVCPQTTEYNEAIQNLRNTVSDEELRYGQPELNRLGMPSPYAGNFADVYKVCCPQTGNTWAVKCFTRETPGRKERYREISSHLEHSPLPFMVDFQFVEPGIRIGGQWHSFLKMRWVEGLSLNRFVGDHVNERSMLAQLLEKWVKLSVRLRSARVAHGDLQHGNVLLVRAREKHRLHVRLIDYDGMFVPGLAGTRPGEVGHPAYQHPQRVRDGIYSADVDRFSHLAICCAIQCLVIGREKLWSRFDNGDNLLFRESDFQSPENSELLATIWSLRDPTAHALVGWLVLASQLPLDRVPWLDELVTGREVRPLSGVDEQQVAAILGGRASAVAVSPQSAADVPVADRPRSKDDSPDASGEASSDSPRREFPRFVRAPLEPPPQKAARTPPELLLQKPAHSQLPAKIANSIGMKLVLIPPGDFLMGSPVGDAEANRAEQPQHRVRITKPFYLGECTVTHADYRQVMGRTPSDYQAREDNVPVENISWDEAVEFCRKLSALPKERASGRMYRLPTEAEWEYACRANATTRWHCGNLETILEEYAWVHGNSTGRSHSVGTRKPNAFGLYDMHGNVWQWCVDWLDEAYYHDCSRGVVCDPTGPPSGSARVARGGSWFDPATCARSANRAGFAPDYELGLTGFRVAVTAG